MRRDRVGPAVSGRNSMTESRHLLSGQIAPALLSWRSRCSTDYHCPRTAELLECFIAVGHATLASFSAWPLCLTAQFREFNPTTAAVFDPNRSHTDSAFVLVFGSAILSALFKRLPIIPGTDFDELSCPFSQKCCGLSGMSAAAMTPYDGGGQCML